MNQEHIPVLLNEAINGLNIRSNGIYVDMTLGRGGHSSEILKKLSSSGTLICIDQDDEAIKLSQERLSTISNNFRIVKSNFRNIDKVLNSLSISQVDGFLFDLGVSSPQFDNAERGFSYRSDAELDMRMDLENKVTAKFIVNNYSLEELTKIFRDYGEDKFSYQIAKQIIKERENKEISTTEELVEIIKKSKPKKELLKKGHPAKQIFQALRIEVNDEMNSLKTALEKCFNYLKVNGRVSIITFQSLEDRIVKEKFKELSVIEGNRYNFDVKIETPSYELVNKKPITASKEELLNNPRSSSAKLRIIEKIK